MDSQNKERIWELVGSVLHNEATRDEINELDILLSETGNKEIRDSVFRLHPMLKNVMPLYEASSVRSWIRIESTIQRKKLRIYYKIVQYAAIAVFAFGIGVLINPEMPFQGEEKPYYTEIQVPFGQMTEILLIDSTKVWLNSGTKLRYPKSFGKKERLVELEGEAFFKVTPDEIPFKVKLKNNEVEVLGTSFAAIAYPDEDFIQVTLVEGSVQVNDKFGNPVRSLKPAQQLHVPDNPKEKIKIRSVNTLFYESWINGQIKFDEERLSDVARRMERWYNVEITFESNDIGDIRFTGTILKNKPVDQSMQAIAMLLPIKIEHRSNLNSKDLIIISKK